jgi:hypothetical protein
MYKLNLKLFIKMHIEEFGHNDYMRSPGSLEDNQASYISVPGRKRNEADLFLNSEIMQ